MRKQVLNHPQISGLQINPVQKRECNHHALLTYPWGGCVCVCTDHGVPGWWVCVCVWGGGCSLNVKEWIYRIYTLLRSKLTQDNMISSGKPLSIWNEWLQINFCDRMIINSFLSEYFIDSLLFEWNCSTRKSLFHSFTLRECGGGGGVL